MIYYFFFLSFLKNQGWTFAKKGTNLSLCEQRKIFSQHIMAAKALTVGHEDGKRPSPVTRNEGKEPREAREV